ncbi:MAG: hypothetical protein QOD83_3296 [Solirubrobacteraceae bacterium]|jgi:hypothetical protein|nr:hypothetical protein [Solirubrobacteraceae bacterium]
MRRLLLLIAVSILVPVAPADATFFLGDPVDGPNADVVSLGDVDLARDATGALAYIRQEAGVDHIFVARFADGAFQAPERIDGALAAAGSQPVVGAADGGRLVVVFVASGTVYGVVRPAAGQAFSAPVPLGLGKDPSVDLSLNGTAFASFSSAGDVRVSRLDRRTNTWATLPAPADIDPARDAGSAGARSRVAVSADGIGVVTWGEAGHVFARKMFGTAFSSAPQDLTPPDVDGRVTALSELPEIEGEDDSSYAWVVFRQRFADGGDARILATRERGTAFDAPAAIDPGGEAVGDPRLAMTGRGVGLAMTAGATIAIASVLDKDAFASALRLFTPSAARPAVAPAVSENNDGLMAAVLGGPGETPYVRVRPYESDGTVGRELVVSRPELGAVDGARGLDAAADRAGGFVVAWVQGGPGSRQIVAAYDDRPPLAFTGYSFQRCCHSALPRLTWQPAFNLWGPSRYQVLVDGNVVGETTDTALQLSAPLAGPTHRWQVRATDARGQFKRTRSRLLRIDDVSPRLTMRYQRNKRNVTLAVRARDPNRAGHRVSGMARINVAWGDSTPAARGFFEVRASHRYRGGGSYSLEITAVDKAGNETVNKRTVRIG